MFCGRSGYNAFETLSLSRPAEYVLEVALNRPDKSNAMNRTFWAEIRDCFSKVSSDVDTRVVLLTGNGRNFTAGLDLADHMSLFSGDDSVDVSRRALAMRSFILSYQDSFTQIEKVLLDAL
jgi:Delta3,5-Delta2,4-dienoyl-CoA isomerase